MIVILHGERVAAAAQPIPAKKLRGFAWWIPLVVLLAGGASTVWGQSDTTGALIGTVADAKGSGIPGAIVTIHNEATGYAQKATTASDGRYGFPTLAPGMYVVELSAAGFKTIQVPSVLVNVSEDS